MIESIMMHIEALFKTIYMICRYGFKGADEITTKQLNDVKLEYWRLTGRKYGEKEVNK